MEGAKTACESKESEIASINGKTENLSGIASEVLERCLALEGFLLGKQLVSETEKERKEPVGWFQQHGDAIDAVRDKLGLAMNSLRTLTQITK